MSSLPQPRLVVTGHEDNGISTYISDTTISPFHPFGTNASSITPIHSSPIVPVSNTSPIPNLTNTMAKSPPNGVLFVCTDFAPGTKTPMHRTLSLDYIAILSGEIICILDGTTEEKVLKTGDIMIQRGTNHSWENRTASWVRVMFVMVGSDAVRDGEGNVMGDTQFDKSEVVKT